MDEESISLYAFWPYDKFPYILGAKVDRQEGMIFYPKNYGGHSFKAKFFLPHELGGKLKEYLSEIQEERRAEEKALDIKYKKKLNAILSQYGQQIK